MTQKKWRLWRKLSAMSGHRPERNLKEFPWPGSRCGWIEVYNKDKDEIFAQYVKSIMNAKMLEVCSTTLPQSVIPAIMSDPRYESHLEERRGFYKKKSRESL